MSDTRTFSDHITAKILSVLTHSGQGENKNWGEKINFSCTSFSCLAFPELGTLSKFAILADCQLFLYALQRYGLLSNFNGEEDFATIFCPIDSVYKTFSRSHSLAAFEMNILLNHVGMKRKKCSMAYSTPLYATEGKILVHAVKENGKVWLSLIFSMVFISMTSFVYMLPVSCWLVTSWPVD